MTPYFFVVVKDRAVIDCTQSAAEATKTFLSQNAYGIYKIGSLAELRLLLSPDDSNVVPQTAFDIVKTWEDLLTRANRLGDDVQRGFEKMEIPEKIDKQLRNIREFTSQGMAKLKTMIDRASATIDRARADIQKRNDDQ
jgi:hypothetical protein